ncbi:MAG: DinB family protein [Rhodoferax sp.]|uniref:DinB family protein n=1 Tax=Rhodoferax sp. TaxID=50421 RepID=UPI0032659228
MPQDPLSHHFTTMAYNNAWANHRLLTACARLAQAEFEARRTGFFPSIKATLNHILTVDLFYMDAFEREARAEAPHPRCTQFFEVEEPFGTCQTLHAAQAAVDRRWIAYCEALDDASLSRTITILRALAPQQETRTRLLAHVFAHQIHHRGQVHAMLSGTSVEPPQLDEFFCTMDAPSRAQELAELGWSESRLWT